MRSNLFLLIIIIFLLFLYKNKLYETFIIGSQRTGSNVRRISVKPIPRPPPITTSPVRR